MKPNKANKIHILSSAVLVLALLLVLLPASHAASPQRGQSGSAVLPQQSADFTRMEEVHAIYKDATRNEYMLFLANTPSVLIVNNETVFESMLGMTISFNSLAQMIKGRIVKVEAGRDAEGRLLASKLTVVDRSAENLKIINDSRKAIILGNKDYVPASGKGVKRGH